MYRVLNINLQCEVGYPAFDSRKSGAPNDQFVVKCIIIPPLMEGAGKEFFFCQK